MERSEYEQRGAKSPRSSGWRAGSRHAGQRVLRVAFRDFVSELRDHEDSEIIYVIAIVLAGLSALGNFIFGITLLASSTSPFVGAGVAVLGVVVILLTPVVFIVEVVVARVLLETVIVLFRIAENTGRMLREGGEQ